MKIKLVSMMSEQNRFHLFLKLAGIEFVIAGLLTLAIALLEGLKTTTLIALLVVVGGIVCLISLYFLRNYAPIISRIDKSLSSKYGLIALLIIPLGISLFLFTRTPSIESLYFIGIIIFCIWLIGLEAIFLFQLETHPFIEVSITKPYLATFSIIISYGILLIPSKGHSFLDGFPWNTPSEFIFATLLLPFAFLFGKNFLSKKTVTLLLAFLFVIKLLLTSSLPQSGLGVHAYTNEEELNSGKWQKSYETYLFDSFTQVAQFPYYSFREFPVEWINTHAFTREQFWLAIKLNGAINLQEDERLIFIVTGAEQAEINLVDIHTNQNLQAVILKSNSNIDSKLFNETSGVKQAEIKGLLIFPEYKQFRFEPLILYSDGSTRSALSEIWLSTSALDFQNEKFEAFLNLIALSLLNIILFSLLDGILAYYRSKKITPIDLYLAVSGLMLYYLATILEKPSINLFFICVVFIFAFLKLFDYSKNNSAYSWVGYFFSLGIPSLLMFLPLDINELRSVLLLPPYQDAMEYQMLARNIYVKGDIFLIQTPPWSYKVLFPYIIGFIHILFGQSMSAQLFLSVWCIILSMLLMTELSMYFGVSTRLSFVVSILLMILLLMPISFVYYFRFGLIEPSAILLLLAAAHFAKEKKYITMLFIGVIAGMLRLNYAGAIFSVILFMSSANIGAWQESWLSLLKWCRNHWQQLLIYLLAIPMPSLLITYLYSLLYPFYTLSPDLNQQDSAFTIFESLKIVIIGGDTEYLSTKFINDPIGGILIALIIVTGLLIALMSLVYRQGVFSKIDLRLSLFLLSMLPVYIVLKPIAYFPRYSWSFLPPAIILITLFIQYLFPIKSKSSQLVSDNK